MGQQREGFTDLDRFRIFAIAFALQHQGEGGAEVGGLAVLGAVSVVWGIGFGSGLRTVGIGSKNSPRATIAKLATPMVAGTTR